MNLQEYDIHKLTKLWQASNGNPDFKKLVEQELQNQTLANTNFSREYLFKVSKVQKNTITISFIPTTDSYKDFGAYVRIDLLLSNEEKVELEKNHSQNPPINTGGQLRAKALDKEKLTEIQIAKLEQKGFHTQEILEVLYLG